ncbi:MAG TPA: hypothetical protein VF201_07600 [Nitrolancea sp.]
MVSQQRAHSALNLSYVLHERSDSDTVRQYVRAHEAEQRRCGKAIRQLATLSDAELGSRLIVVDQTGDFGAPLPSVVQIISVDVGAVDLLPRLLHVAGFWPPDAEAIAGLLDAAQFRDERSLTFFGAPAALNAPTLPGDSSTRWLFATAVLRPGYSSILLRVTALDGGDEDRAPDWQSTTHLAEAVIREFPLQWWCARPLWERPVEETLPEFQSTENGMTACGR